jgi:hypothetical protein
MGVNRFNGFQAYGTEMQTVETVWMRQDTPTTPE